MKCLFLKLDNIYYIYWTWNICDLKIWDMKVYNRVYYDNGSIRITISEPRAINCNDGLKIYTYRNESGWGNRRQIRCIPLGISLLLVATFKLTAWLLPRSFNCKTRFLPYFSILGKTHAQLDKMKTMHVRLWLK